MVEVSRNGALVSVHGSMYGRECILATNKVCFLLRSQGTLLSKRLAMIPRLVEFKTGSSSGELLLESLLKCLCDVRASKLVPGALDSLRLYQKKEALHPSKSCPPMQSPIRRLTTARDAKVVDLLTHMFRFLP